MNEAQLKEAGISNPRDYREYVGDELGETHSPGDPEQPMRCHECAEPAYYDYSHRDYPYEGYHHVNPGAAPCFLINDGDGHPNYQDEWEASARELGVAP